MKGCVNLYHTISPYNEQEKKKPFENIVRKGENAGNQHFLLFPPRFLPIPKRICVLKLHLLCRLQMLSIWLVVSGFNATFTATVISWRLVTHMSFLAFSH